MFHRLPRTRTRRELAALRAQLDRQTATLATVEALVCPFWLREAIAVALQAGWTIEPVAAGVRFSAPHAEPCTVSRAALVDGQTGSQARGELSLRLSLPLSPAALDSPARAESGVRLR